MKIIAIHFLHVRAVVQNEKGKQYSGNISLKNFGCIYYD